MTQCEGGNHFTHGDTFCWIYGPKTKFQGSSGIGIGTGTYWYWYQCWCTVYTHKDQGRHYFRQLELQPRECVRQRDRGSGRLGERMDSEVPSVLPVDQHDPHNAGALSLYIKAVNHQHYTQCHHQDALLLHARLDLESSGGQSSCRCCWSKGNLSQFYFRDTISHFKECFFYFQGLRPLGDLMTQSEEELKKQAKTVREI